MKRVEGKRVRLWVLIEDIKIGMLVTHNGRSDQVRARLISCRP